jgi:hypothetical protein
MEKAVQIDVRMSSVPEFIKLPPHPCQRDTEEHAAFAEKRYLTKAAPTHALVATVIYNDVVYKLDGHTRAYMWTHRGLARPPVLHDIRYTAQTLSDFEDLYYLFDEKQGGKTPRATLDGVAHAAGFDFESELLKKNTYMMAVYAAMNGSFKESANFFMDYKKYSSLSSMERRHAIRDVLSQWGEIFKIVDEIGPKASKGWKSPVLAAMFMSVRRYGRNAVPFWAGVIADDGFHRGGLKDGIQLACDKIRESTRCKAEDYETVTGQLLSCVDASVAKVLLHHVRGVGVNTWHKKMLAEPMPVPAIPGLNTSTTTVEEVFAPAAQEMVNVTKSPANADVLSKLREKTISFPEAEKLTGLPKSILVRQLKKNGANGSALPTA